MNQHSEKISIEELICDTSFQEYCLGSNLSSQVYWEEWIQKNSHRASDIREARELIYILSARQGNRLEQLNQLREGMSQTESFREIIATASSSLPLPAKKENNSRKIYLYAGAVAASLLLVVSIYFSVNQHGSQNPTITKTVQETLIQAGDEARKTIILADGSLITMGRQSTIRLKTGFDKSNREVWLSGEAYFDVKSDKEHPFIVHSTNSDIKVLGTIFNVKSYPGSSLSETFLIHGRVEVIPHDTRYKSIILKPNQKLITSLISANTAGTIQNFHNEVITLSERKHVTEEVKWVRNQINIEDEPLSEIAGKLEKWYGITIVFEDDNVKNLRYSGLFESESVIKALEALQLSYPFNFRVEQDKIHISSK